MEKDLLRRVQLAELEILVDVKKVCDENGIGYFLSGGTLIGAMRHGGFIPWDDDVDIGMLRPEFEKFKEIAQEKLGNKYFFQSWDTDAEFPFASAKVRKIGTLYREATSINTNYHSELFIDIFPYDNYPDNIDGQMKQGKEIDTYRKTFMMKSGMTPWKMANTLVRKVGVYIKNIPYIIRARSCDKQKEIERYNSIMTQYNNSDTAYVFEECNGTDYGKFVVTRKCIGNLSPISFEGITFSGPENPDEYLKSIYGDYMQLPPENKRVNHSVVEVVL